MNKNKNIDIDALLRRLPAEKAGDDFTGNVLTRLAALPASRRRLNGWGIAGICAGGVALAVLVWWAGDAFSLWPSIDGLFEKSALYTSFSQIAAAFAVLFDRTVVSPAVWNGFIAGILLLLLDAAIQKHRATRKREA
ncbi:MAG: hypothetical protein LBS12_02785 [Prevotellaceae bacterium]|nr:hypothetical protein [Prevotellaceae bacterium]